MARPFEIAAGDIGKRHAAIQQLLAVSEDEAFDKVIDFADSFGSTAQKHDAIVISREFYEYKKAERRGLIPFDALLSGQKSIVYRCLDLLEEIVRERQFSLAA